MMIIYFFHGLSFFGLGLAAYLQLHRSGEFPLRKHLPWLAAFGFATGATGWVEMFQVSETNLDIVNILGVAQMFLQPLSGLLLLIFGWGIVVKLNPLPRWAVFIPGVLIVPIAYVITYALSTFVTPSPIEIPIDIWSRYLLYWPGSVLAGAGFLRQWYIQRKQGYMDVANLMLGAGIAFLVEAFVMGLVVPAAPYGPASYYNYDRVAYDAYSSEATGVTAQYGLTAWLDYQAILDVTGLPIQFWRLLSALAVTGFVTRGLDVFEAMQKRAIKKLQDERDRAKQMTFDAQIAARKTAESWTDTLVQINRQIVQLEDVDQVLLYIVAQARQLLHSSYSAICTLDQSGTCLELKFHACQNRQETLENPTRVDNLLLLETVFSLKSYRSRKDEQQEKLAGLGCPDAPYPNGVAIVPLAFDEKPIGGLWIAQTSEESYSETDLIWLECMADQVVIAIQHGLMTSQLQSLSVTEERTRIAREMHDGLAQVLGYMNVQVQTLDAYLQKGKLDSLQFQLSRMRNAVNQAHADVREKILSLRTTLSNEKGLIPAIEEYLEEFGIQAQIETHFENHVQDELDIASLAEVQLVCILQEALTNVRKHAKAQNVNVFVTKQGVEEAETVRLVVQDDGVGFVGVVQKSSFGLQIMRERAQSVGGRLEVHSIPGQGTEVICSIPCLRQERLVKTNITLDAGP